MSNFSNIGFQVASPEDLQVLIQKTYGIGTVYAVDKGSYILYSDDSDAELWIQRNEKKQIIGINPHYNGLSRRNVCLTQAIKGKTSQLDGSFSAWADPSDDTNPESGLYPFVFDVPDFKRIKELHFPINQLIQLTAFAKQLQVYTSEDEFHTSQTTNMKLSAHSFIPTGLFSTQDTSDVEKNAATASFSGSIKAFKKKKNELSQCEFYCLLIDTYGGEVDVVSDCSFFDKEPVINGIVHGEFWLSGQLIDPPKPETKKFWKRIFGK